MPPNKPNRRKKIREIAESYLKELGLTRWKLTSIYLGIPDHMLETLNKNYPEAKNGFDGCVWVTTPFKFLMAIDNEVSEDDLPTVIGHEITHILLNNLYEATQVNRPSHRTILKHLEIACNRVGRLVARRRKEL